MPSCVVKECSNNTTKHKKRQGITFHRFPASKPALKEAWINTIREWRNDKDWLPTKSSVICSDHFDSRDLYSPNRRLRVSIDAMPKKMSLITASDLLQQLPDSTEPNGQDISPPQMVSVLPDTPIFVDVVTGAEHYSNQKHLEITNEIKLEILPENAQILEKGDRIRCKECPRYSTTSEEMLLRHVRQVHRGENPFQCYMCEYSTYNKVLFEEHIRIHKGIKPYQCSHCPYRSASKKNRKKHEKIHRPDNPLKCKDCDFIGRNRRCLDHHSLEHQTNITIKKCPDCDYIAKDDIQMRRHWKRHSRLPAKCEICGHSFTDGSGQTAHKRRQRKCVLCDDTLCTKSLLDKHMLTVHNVKAPKNELFQCAVCEWSSNLKAKILLHLIHHPYQDVDDSLVDLSVLRKHGIVCGSR